MTDHAQVIAASERLAAAIARRDGAAIRALLAPGFVHRSHGGASVNEAAFLLAVEALPGEIEFVRLENLHVDLTPAGALLTGVQHARLRVDNDVINDRRRFIDWFVTTRGEWRIQAAVDLPEQVPP
jgi:hypothetical protein